MFKPGLTIHNVKRQNTGEMCAVVVKESTDSAYLLTCAHVAADCINQDGSVGEGSRVEKHLGSIAVLEEVEGVLGGEFNIDAAIARLGDEAWSNQVPGDESAAFTVSGSATKDEEVFIGSGAIRGLVVELDFQETLEAPNVVRCGTGEKISELRTGLLRVKVAEGSKVGPGSSGGPVWSLREGQPVLLGIFIASDGPGTEALVLPIDRVLRHFGVALPNTTAFEGRTGSTQTTEPLSAFEAQIDRLVRQANLNTAARLFNINRPSGGGRNSGIRAASDPEPLDISRLLEDSANVPGTTSIVAVPDDLQQNDLVLLEQIQLLDSYISVMSALDLYNRHPEPFDISNPQEAIEFTNALANSRNFVISGGEVLDITAYVPIRNVVRHSLEKSVTALELHTDLLSALFSAFNLTESTFQQLDAILTSFTQNAQSLNLEVGSSSETVGHFITYYYFQEVEGLDLKAARIRMFYLQLSRSSWELSIGKSSVNKFDFSMNYFDLDASMSQGLVAGNLNTIRERIEALTSQDAETINRLLAMRGVNADPIPA